MTPEVVMPGFARLVLMVALAGSRPLVAAAEPTGNPTEGHRLALKICSACHVVASDQQNAPLLHHPAPDFETIAARPGISAPPLQLFILTTHLDIGTPENMPNPQLTEDQAADIASYIASLRSSNPEPRK
jgi:mono/diheme cytochrome c family protein